MISVIPDQDKNKTFKRNVSEKEAVEWLSLGELGAIPTETVYGFAAHAQNAKAIAQIFAFKNRPAHNPLILHNKPITESKGYGIFAAQCRKSIPSFKLISCAMLRFRKWIGMHCCQKHPVKNGLPGKFY